MESAKKIWDELPDDGSRWSEKDIKNLTGLNFGQIKNAKKWLKDNELIKSYKGRGGYFSRIEGAEFPKEENTMTAGQKRAAAAEEKRALSAEDKRRAKICENAKSIAEKEFPDADEINVQWKPSDLCIVEVWKDKRADIYRCFP